jgi:hypothetical protein
MPSSRCSGTMRIRSGRYQSSISVTRPHYKKIAVSITCDGFQQFKQIETERDIVRGRLRIAESSRRKVDGDDRAVADFCNCLREFGFLDGTCRSPNGNKHQSTSTAYSLMKFNFNKRLSSIFDIFFLSRPLCVSIYPSESEILPK